MLAIFRHFRARAGKDAGVGRAGDSLSFRLFSELFGLICLRLQQARVRYRGNCAREEEFSRLPFAEVLRHWGIAGDEELQRVLRAKSQEVVLGLLLVIFAFTALCLQWGCGLIPLLSVCACCSVCLLGLVLALTAFWRLDCLKRRRFIPLKKWILGRGV